MEENLKKIFALLAALCACGAALAQVDENTTNFTPSGITLRAGIGFPVDSALRDDRAFGLLLGLDYELAGTIFGSTDLYLGFDYITLDQGVFGISVNRRFPSSMGNIFGNRQLSSHAFLGVGGAFVDGISMSDAAFIVRGGFGFEMAQNTFVEIGGWIGADVNDVNPSAFFITIGYRFP
jgi:hypothetical protein